MTPSDWVIAQFSVALHFQIDMPPLVCQKIDVLFIFKISNIILGLIHGMVEFIYL